MSRLRVSAITSLSAETRLRVGLAAVSVLVALVLAALLTALSLLRGAPPSSAMLIGLALGLCAELLCLDLALRRLSRRLDGAGHARRACRPSAIVQAAR